jgi:hypothetical protein
LRPNTTHSPIQCGYGPDRQLEASLTYTRASTVSRHAQNGLRQRRLRPPVGNGDCGAHFGRRPKRQELRVTTQRGTMLDRKEATWTFWSDSAKHRKRLPGRGSGPRHDPATRDNNFAARRWGERLFGEERLLCGWFATAPTTGTTTKCRPGTTGGRQTARYVLPVFYCVLRIVW